MKPISLTTTTKPLFAALFLVLATTACQRDEDMMTTPSDDVSATTPVDMTPVDSTPPPPMQQVDPCANLMGTQLDECLRRQTEQATPPPSEQLPPTQDILPERGDTPTPPEP